MVQTHTLPLGALVAQCLPTVRPKAFDTTKSCHSQNPESRQSLLLLAGPQNSLRQSENKACIPLKQFDSVLRGFGSTGTHNMEDCRELPLLFRDGKRKLIERLSSNLRFTLASRRRMRAIMRMWIIASLNSGLAL